MEVFLPRGWRNKMRIPSEPPRVFDCRILYVDHLSRADQERARKMSTEWGTGKWDEMEVPGTFRDTQSFPTDKAQAGMRGSLAQLSSKGSMKEGRHRMRVATKANARRGSVEDIPGSHHIDIPKSSLRHSRGSPITRDKTVRASKDDRQPTTLGFDRQKRQTRSQVVEI
jgi:hypothetical protein